MAFTFDANDARRIAEAVKSKERRPQNPATIRQSPAERWNPGCYIAKTGAAGVPAMAGLTPGSEPVTRYDWDGTSIADSGEDLVAYNIMPTAIGANKFVYVAFVQGDWFVIAEAC